jgi:hypothetical protein
MSSCRSTTLTRFYSRLSRWAQSTGTFAESVISGWDGEPQESLARDRIIYRLRSWPELPAAHRTAVIYRMLSVMSSRPVNRHWILASSRMRPKQLDGLLRGLIAQGVVEQIDPASFA